MRPRRPSEDLPAASPSFGERGQLPASRTLDESLLSGDGRLPVGPEHHVEPFRHKLRLVIPVSAASILSCLAIGQHTTTKRLSQVARLQAYIALLRLPGCASR